MIAIRGATTVCNNDGAEINLAVKELLNKIFTQNKVALGDVISIFFSMTEDLDKLYPANAAREMGLNSAALICLQELKIKNSLNKCIRVLMHCESDKKQAAAKHVFLNGATVLRPDLSGGDNA
jgi:monofunctional chorismate mutase